jgi:hypothetical protein
LRESSGRAWACRCASRIPRPAERRCPLLHHIIISGEDYLGRGTSALDSNFL